MKRQYDPFWKDWKDEVTKEVKGTNFIGYLKYDFPFKLKVYYDLPVGDKKMTYVLYQFMCSPLFDYPDHKKVYGFPASSLKKNKQMDDCVNFFVKKNQKVPVIDLVKDVGSVESSSILNTIEEGMKKTKAFYAKNPPLKDQNIKVFETTISKNQDGSFVINNLMNKFYNGKVYFGSLIDYDPKYKEYAVIYLPFDGTNKNILVPMSDFTDHKNGSFSVKIKANSHYDTIPVKNLKELSRFEFLKQYKEEWAEDYDRDMAQDKLR